jgi:hypothetical protein
MNGFDKDETVRLLSKAWQEYLTRDNYHPLDEYELDRDGVSEWTDEAVREFASHEPALTFRLGFFLGLQVSRVAKQGGPKEPRER